MDLLLALSTRASPPRIAPARARAARGSPAGRRDAAAPSSTSCVMLDGAGGREHHVAGVVVPRQIGADRVRREALTVSGVPRIGRPSGWLGEGGLHEAVEDEIVRRVLDGADLLQDDALLALELVRVEAPARSGCRRGCRAPAAGPRRARARNRRCLDVVAALRSPPTLSISSAMSRAVRRAVPLNAMCSSRCDRPCSCGAHGASRRRSRRRARRLPASAHALARRCAGPRAAS